MTHIYIGNPTIIGSDNGLSPGRCQAIIWTNDRISLIWPLGTNFSEILIEIYLSSFKKMHLKMSSAKWWSMPRFIDAPEMTWYQLNGHFLWRQSWHHDSSPVSVSIPRSQNWYICWDQGNSYIKGNFTKKNILRFESFRSFFHRSAHWLKLWLCTK